MHHIRANWLSVCAAAMVGGIGTTAGVAGAQADQIKINELRIDQPGANLDSYIELKGPSGTSLDGLAYLVIGDQSGVFPPLQNGYVELFIDLTGNTIGDDGFFVITKSSFTLCEPELIAPLNFENYDNVTHMLVNNTCGLGLGSDVDTDDNGLLDSTVTCAIIDSVALVRFASSDPDGFNDEFVYSVTRVGSRAGSHPSHVFLCPDSTWLIGDFNNFPNSDESPCFENSSPICSPPDGTAKINEIRIDDENGDENEYFELNGTPGTDLTGLSYIVIGDGDSGSGSGVIELVVSLDDEEISPDGYFVVATSRFNLGGPINMIIGDTNLFENNDNVTHLLVRDFTGKEKDDLDTNDDGLLDVTPWSERVDGVALINNGGTGDLVYSTTTIGPDPTGSLGHCYRCGLGGPWRVGAFNENDDTDTPGVENLPCSGTCGRTDPISCFETNAEGGCADQSCCTLVTDVDPSCAENWDSDCVNTARAFCLGAGPAPDVRLSELRTKQEGRYEDDFFEVSGAAGSSLDGVSLVVLGRSGTDTNGVIEGAVNLSGFEIPASGFFVVAEETFRIGKADKVAELPFKERGNRFDEDYKTYLLVYNFTGTVNTDLDADDDCTMESEPWDVILDSISIINSQSDREGTANCRYSQNTVGSESFFTPAHIFVCDTFGGSWNHGSFEVYGNGYNNPITSSDSPGGPNPTDCSTVSTCGDGVCFVKWDDQYSFEGEYSVSVALGDLDGDGSLDAWLTGYGGRPNVVWLNNGSGYFTEAGNYSLGQDQTISVAFGDLDADGDLDAFTGNRFTEPNTVWFNDGCGVFSASDNDYGIAQYSNDVALGDLDGDGTLDALFANGDYSEGIPNTIWLNTFGTGVFTASNQTLGNSQSRSVALGDLDGNGTIDAWIANGYFDSESDIVWLNDGTGTFTNSGQALPLRMSTSVALGDLDDDGDLDALVTHPGENTVWINDGTGTFTIRQDFGASYSYSVALGDLDLDGDLDAWIANIGPNRVWINDGTGTFTDSGLELGNRKSFSVALGDLDNDGGRDLDAWVVNDTQLHAIWFNTTEIESCLDTDGDGEVGGSELALIIGNWGTPEGDITGDGTTDGQDLTVILANWGPCGG